jgi:hypothetical protein
VVSEKFELGKKRDWRENNEGEEVGEWKEMGRESHSNVTSLTRYWLKMGMRSVQLEEKRMGCVQLSLWEE